MLMVIAIQIRDSSRGYHAKKAGIKMQPIKDVSRIYVSGVSFYLLSISLKYFDPK